MVKGIGTERLFFQSKAAAGTDHGFNPVEPILSPGSHTKRTWITTTQPLSGDAQVP